MKFRKESSEKKSFSVKKKNIGKKKVYILTAAVLTISVAAGTVYWQYRSNQKPAAPEQTIQATETKAVISSISNTIVGTGNLETDTAVSLKIPSGITISELKVESGDHVSSGDVLAEVDSASVYTAMEDVQETITALDEQIAELQEDSEDETVSAPVDGRIKKIYIQEDGDVSDCMLENGALVILSIDGKMAVDLENTETELAQDDTVTVTLSAGTQVEGTVESVNGSSCTITMTDSGVGMGDTAAVTDAEGNTIGSGTIYVHQPLEVTGTMGTVTEISVAEDEAVESGDTLLTLEESDETAEYASLHAQREALAETLTELLELSKTGTITADMDGTIEEIYVSEEGTESTSQSSSSSGSSSVQAMNMSYTKTTTGSGTANTANTASTASAVKAVKTVSTSSTGFVRLSAMTDSGEDVVVMSDSEADVAMQAETASTDTPAVQNEEGLPETDVSEGTEEEPDIGEGDSEEEETPSQTQTLYLSIADASSGNAQTLGIVVPRTGGSPQTQISSTDGSYTGSISWNPGDGRFMSEVTYQAAVTLYAGEGYCFSADSISQTSAGVLSGITVSEDGSTLSFTITYPETQGDTDNSGESEGTQGDAEGSGGESGTQNGENSGLTDGSSQTTSGSSQNASGQGSGTGQSSGTASGGTSAGAASGSQSSSVQESSTQTEDGESQEDTSSEYSTDTTAFTISGDESMLLSVSVDELDINSVSLGQQAEITFDAIEDKTFEGTVTKVGNTASVSGGVAKYTVEITITKDEEMKAGMNASATIVIEEKENIVTIPVNALQERGDQIFVYTEQDEEGNLSGEQQVTTGLSDGENVEITEGLSEGDVVYYQKTGSVNSDSGSASGMPGGDMEMPGGGQNSDGGGGFGGNMGGGMGTPPER